MPKTNLTEAQKTEREKEINTRKNYKDLQIQEWYEKQKKKIEEDINKSTAQALKEKKDQIESQLSLDRGRLEMNMRDAWSKHLIELKKELDDLSKNDPQEYIDNVAAINTTHDNQIAEEEKKYKEEIAEIKQTYDEQIAKQEQEHRQVGENIETDFRKQLEKEKQELQKELEEKIKKNETELKAIDSGISQIAEAIKTMRENIKDKTKKKTKDEASQLKNYVEQLEISKKKHESDREKLSKKISAEKDELGIVAKKLDEVLAQPQKSKRLAKLEVAMKESKNIAETGYSAGKSLLDDVMKEQKNKAETDHNTRKAQIEEDRKKALSARKEELQKFKDAKATEYETDRKVTMDEIVYRRRLQNLEDQAKGDELIAENDLNAKANYNKRQRLRRLEIDRETLRNRLYSSIGFNLEVEDLKNSHKKGDNTREFNEMVEALEGSVTAVEKCELGDEVVASIHKKCMDAYKGCDRYIQAKNNQNFLKRWFRSSDGMRRLEMAAAMKDKLLAFYPKLEQALQVERGQNIASDAPQRASKANVPAEESETMHKDVKKLLDEAKKELTEEKKFEKKEKDNTTVADKALQKNNFSKS